MADHTIGYMIGSAVVGADPHAVIVKGGLGKELSADLAVPKNFPLRQILCQACVITAVYACLSECVLGFEDLLPTPGATVSIAVEPFTSNPELTDRLLDVLESSGIAPCREVAIPGTSYTTCFVQGWNDDPIAVDRENAIIEIGDYPVYNTGLSGGHSARLERIGDDVLRITVKGLGPYSSDLPNDEVVRKVAVAVVTGLPDVRWTR